MNWTWSLRSSDGGMNGLEFTRATTAGGFDRVLVHAAPAQLQIEIRRADGECVLSAEVQRADDYSPMTLLTIDDGAVERAWEHAADHRWWRWQVEFSNHTNRPDDWSPA